MHPRDCLICSTSFTPNSKLKPNQRFCSSKCVKTNYRLNNPEKDRASKRKYAEKNKEKHSLATEKYRKANPDYYRQYTILRNRNVRQACPKWLSEFDLLWLDEIYDLAVKRGLEVDHIVPITNKKVCGLHVPWNLQLLTRAENARKSNKFDEDVIAIIKEQK